MDRFSQRRRALDFAARRKHPRARPTRLARRLAGIENGHGNAALRKVVAGRPHSNFIDYHVDNELTRDRAASLRIGRPHVMSHDSAALELDLAILRAEPRLTHVTRPGVVGSHLRHGVKQVAMSQGNLGCPHEEGEDFPLGEDCPFCPFWKGKQGSNRRD